MRTRVNLCLLCRSDIVYRQHVLPLKKVIDSVAIKVASLPQAVVSASDWFLRKMNDEGIGVWLYKLLSDLRPGPAVRRKEASVIETFAKIVEIVVDLDELMGEMSKRKESLR